MRCTLYAFALLFLAPVAAGAATARMPKPELAGIRIGMEAEEAHERLAKQGAAVPSHEQEHEAEEQESWSLRRGPWGYVALGIREERVRWVSVFARREGPRVRYRDLGPMKRAQRNGTYFVIWRVPAHGAVPSYSVIARGTDSTYVSSVSVTVSPEARVSATPSAADSAR